MTSREISEFDARNLDFEGEFTVVMLSVGFFFIVKIWGLAGSWIKQNYLWFVFRCNGFGVVSVLD